MCALGHKPDDEREDGTEEARLVRKEWHPDDLGDAVAETVDAGADRALHAMLDEWAERQREAYGLTREARARVVLRWRPAPGPPDVQALLSRRAAERLLLRAGVPFLRVRGAYLASPVEAIGPDGRTPGECAVVVAEVRAEDGSARAAHLYWRPGPDGLWRLVRAAAELQV